MDEIRKSIFTQYIFLFMCYGLELKSPKNREGRKVTREWRPETESHHNFKSNTLSIILLSNCIGKYWSKGTIKNKGKVWWRCAVCILPIPELWLADHVSQCQGIIQSDRSHRSAEVLKLWITLERKESPSKLLENRRQQQIKDKLYCTFVYSRTDKKHLNSYKIDY